jgi:hypothetical protein
MSQWRANLIARTETADAYQQGALNSYEQIGTESVDIIGCEDNGIMPGELYGCNSKGIPILAAYDVRFHPNHKGAPVPAEIGGAKSVRLLLGREAVLLTRAPGLADDLLNGAAAGRSDLALASLGNNGHGG